MFHRTLKSEIRLYGGALGAFAKRVHSIDNNSIFDYFSHGTVDRSELMAAANEATIAEQSREA